MRTTLPILLLWFGVHNSANADYTDGDAPGTTDGVYIGNALVHRTAENIVITRGRHGLSVTSEHDAWVGAHLRALGEWEEPVRAFIARFALLLAERPSVLPPHEGKTGCLWSSNSIFVVIVVVVRGRGRPRDVAPRVGRPPWSAAVALPRCCVVAIVARPALPPTRDNFTRVATRSEERR